jgi:hypothetical protein
VESYGHKKMSRRTFLRTGGGAMLTIASAGSGMMLLSKFSRDVDREIAIDRHKSRHHHIAGQEVSISGDLVGLAVSYVGLQAGLVSTFGKDAAEDEEESGKK